MGERLLDFFDRASDRGGMPAKLRLAALARMTSSQARAHHDDPDAVARIESAYRTLERELGWKTDAPAVAPAAPLPAPAAPISPADVDARLARLARQQQLVAELLGQRHLFLSSLEATAARITEAVAHAIDVARVGVWLLGPEHQSIVCTDLFERDKAAHSSGIVLPRESFPSYFDALATERTIAADDARTDPRTSCFRESYLEPLGIGSMLDVPIWANGAMVGVICHEHVGDKRVWTDDEERFAHTVGALVAIAIEYKRVTSA